MVWLRKKYKKDGSFVYHVVYCIDGITKSKSTGTNDEKLAKAVFEKFQADLTLEKFGISRLDELGFNREDNKRISLDDFIYDYSEARKSKKDNTRWLDDYALHNFRDFIKNVYLDDVNKAIIEKYKSHRIQIVSSATVNIELKTLRCAFNYAIEANYIKTNPFAKFKFLSSQEDDLPEFLELDEIEAMRKFIDGSGNINFKRLFEFYLNTGARRREALNVEWKDVNFDRHFIFLRHTKTGKTRMVPMNEKLYEVLKGMHQENSNGNLFNYTEDAVTRQFKRYLIKSGVKKDLHLHNIRDTFASHLIMSGVDILTVSRYLGHSNIRITEKYYGHLSPGHYQNSIQKLPY